MTFPEFQAKRKRVTAAEMKRAGVTPNKETQYGWLYPGGLLIESTQRWARSFKHKSIKERRSCPGTTGTIGHAITLLITRTRRCRDIHSTEINHNGGDPMAQR